MNTKIENKRNIPTGVQISKISHSIFIIDEKQKKFPLQNILQNKLKRIGKKINDLKKTPIVTELPDGGVVCWAMASDDINLFQCHTLLRKSLAFIANEKPISISIICQVEAKLSKIWGESAVYVALLNTRNLPSHKKGTKNAPLKKLILYGVTPSIDFNTILATVEGNTLTRELTMTPPNNLTPSIYRVKVKKLAKQNKWKLQEYSMSKLKQMGAGAFFAVGQGSEPQDAAIVNLRYEPKGAKQTIALVGKGICFDTGGHNLKPAKYMNGMHEDMNGSAVVLGIIQAATLAKLPIKLDCWLAIAQNHIGPKAYKQNDVVQALNGMSIEIVHTDAEGRMVLADTLTLASRQKPKAIIDFATLTGCMHVAMGDRYSGAISNRSELSCMAVGAGADAGERIAAFPYDEDYEEDLESKIADIKQCNLEGGPDHIHAARFLGRFVDKDVPWLHIDLSSSNRKGGLGAVSSDVNGFGVNFGLKIIHQIMKLRFKI
jgi:leucyl aminopeptidase|tara:strand:+ start:845 stop:2311 length:1467 start_codon:yes stop_codon:yes gene_type:complete